jgi:hypothetical protein
VFSATPTGDYETYWLDRGGPKVTSKINNL